MWVIRRVWSGYAQTRHEEYAMSDYAMSDTPYSTIRCLGNIDKQTELRDKQTELLNGLVNG